MTLHFIIINIESPFANKAAYYYSFKELPETIFKYFKYGSEYTYHEFIRELNANEIRECKHLQGKVLEKIINKYNDIQDLDINGVKFTEMLSFEGVSLWPFVSACIYFSKPQETLEVVEYLTGLISEYNPDTLKVYGNLQTHQSDTIEAILNRYGLPAEFHEAFFNSSLTNIKPPEAMFVNELHEMIESADRGAIAAYTSHIQKATVASVKNNENVLLVSYPHAWRQTACGEIDRYYEGFKSAFLQMHLEGIRLEVPYYSQIRGSIKDYIDSVLKHDRGGFKSLYFDSYLESTFGETEKLMSLFERKFAILISSQEFLEMFSWEGISFFTPLYEYWKNMFTHYCVKECIPALLISRRIMQDVKPKGIFLIYETGCYGRALIIEAHRAGIRTFGLQHGYIFENLEYLMHKNQSNSPDLESGYYGFIAPTITFVWGEAHRRYLTQSGFYPPNSVEVVGNWMIESKHINTLTNEVLAEYRNRLFGNNKKILLILTSYGFISVIGEIASKIDSNEYSVLIKIHPEEREVSLIASELKRYGIDAVITRDYLVESILSANIVICDGNSSVVVDCLLLNKNITYAYFANEFGYDVPWKDLVFDITNVTRFVEKPKSEALNNLIQDFLLDNGLSEKNITITQTVIKNLSQPKEIDVLCYHNEPYKKLIINYDNFFEALNSEGLSVLPLIHQIRRISFELSNLCNYAQIHKKCPLSQKKDKAVLPSEVVRKTITELGLINYYGVIAFHIYNEPLIDPRLFDFIKYARHVCPDAKILILTNGYYLNQAIADELSGLGVWIIAVSAYSKSEYARLSRLNVAIPYKVFWAELDDRESMYERTPINLQKPCCAPIRDLSIACTGEVILCCLDWKRKHTFGNLKHESLQSILSKQDFVDAARGLASGKRTLDLCTRCDWVR